MLRVVPFLSWRDIAELRLNDLLDDSRKRIDYITPQNDHFSTRVLSWWEWVCGGEWEYDDRGCGTCFIVIIVITTTVFLDFISSLLFPFPQSSSPFLSYSHIFASFLSFLLLCVISAFDFVV